MAYTDLIRAEAAQLFFEGYSLAKIARQIRSRHPEECKQLSLKTVKEWAAKPDRESLTWAHRKAAYLQEAQKSQGERIIDRYGQLTALLDETIGLMSARFREASEKAVDVRSPEYAAQVLLQLLNTRARMLREGLMGDTRIEGARQFQLFFQVLASDPELGPVFERRRPYLLRAYQEKLAKEGVGG